MLLSGGAQPSQSSSSPAGSSPSHRSARVSLDEVPSSSSCDVLSLNLVESLDDNPGAVRPTAQSAVPSRSWPSQPAPLSVSAGSSQESTGVLQTPLDARTGKSPSIVSFEDDDNSSDGEISSRLTKQKQNRSHSCPSVQDLMRQRDGSVSQDSVESLESDSSPRDHPRRSNTTSTKGTAASERSSGQFRGFRSLTSKSLGGLRRSLSFGGGMLSGRKSNSSDGEGKSALKRDSKQLSGTFGTLKRSASVFSVASMFAKFAASSEGSDESGSPISRTGTKDSARNSTMSVLTLYDDDDPPNFGARLLLCDFPRRVYRRFSRARKLCLLYLSDFLGARVRRVLIREDHGLESLTREDWNDARQVGVQKAQDAFHNELADSLWEDDPFERITDLWQYPWQAYFTHRNLRKKPRTAWEMVSGLPTEDFSLLKQIGIKPTKSGDLLGFLNGLKGAVPKSFGAEPSNGSSADEEVNNNLAEVVGDARVEWSLFDIYERRHQFHLSKKVISGFSLLARLSQKLMWVIAVYSIWWSTLVFCFSEVFASDRHLGPDTVQYIFCRTLDSVMDIWYFACTLLCLRTTIVDPDTFKEETTAANIFKITVKQSWFWADLLTSVLTPLRYVIGVESEIANLIGLVKVIRFWRLVFPAKDPLRASGWHWTWVMLKFVLFILIGGHIWGCVWFMIAKSTSDLETHPLILSSAPNRVAQFDETPWAIALYYAYSWRLGVYMVLGADWTGMSSAESSLAAFTAPMGVLISAFVFSQVIVMMQRDSALQTTYAKHVIEVKQALNTLDLPRYLQLRILSFYAYQQLHRSEHTSHSLRRGLSAQLHFELHLVLYYGLVKKSRLFQSAPPRVLRDIVVTLKDQIFLPGDYVYRARDEASEMFFICKGSCSVVNQDLRTLGVTLQTGESFGEVQMLCGNPFACYVRADTYCILAILTKGPFELALRNYPKMAEILVQQMSQQERELLQKRTHFMDRRRQSASAAGRRRSSVAAHRLSNFGGIGTEAAAGFDSRRPSAAALIGGSWNSMGGLGGVNLGVPRKSLLVPCASRRTSNLRSGSSVVPSSSRRVSNMTDSGEGDWPSGCRSKKRGPGEVTPSGSFGLASRRSFDQTILQRLVLDSGSSTGLSSMTSSNVGDPVIVGVPSRKVSQITEESGSENGSNAARSPSSVSSKLLDNAPNQSLIQGLLSEKLTDKQNEHTEHVDVTSLATFSTWKVEVEHSALLGHPSSLSGHKKVSPTGSSSSHAVKNQDALATDSDELSQDDRSTKAPPVSPRGGPPASASGVPATASSVSTDLLELSNQLDMLMHGHGDDKKKKKHDHDHHKVSALGSEGEEQNTKSLPSSRLPSMVFHKAPKAGDHGMSRQISPPSISPKGDTSHVGELEAAAAGLDFRRDQTVGGPNSPKGMVLRSPGDIIDSQRCGSKKSTQEKVTPGNDWELSMLGSAEAARDTFFRDGTEAYGGSKQPARACYSSEQPGHSSEPCSEGEKEKGDKVKKKRHVRKLARGWSYPLDRHHKQEFKRFRRNEDRENRLTHEKFLQSLPTWTKSSPSSSSQKQAPSQLSPKVVESSPVRTKSPRGSSRAASRSAGSGQGTPQRSPRISTHSGKTSSNDETADASAAVLYRRQATGSTQGSNEEQQASAASAAVPDCRQASASTQGSAEQMQLPRSGEATEEQRALRKSVSQTLLGLSLPPSGDEKLAQGISVTMYRSKTPEEDAEDTETPHHKEAESAETRDRASTDPSSKASLGGPSPPRLALLLGSAESQERSLQRSGSGLSLSPRGAPRGASPSVPRSRPTSARSNVAERSPRASQLLPMALGRGSSPRGSTSPRGSVDVLPTSSESDEDQLSMMSKLQLHGRSPRNSVSEARSPRASLLGKEVPTISRFHSKQRLSTGSNVGSHPPLLGFAISEPGTSVDLSGEVSKRTSLDSSKSALGGHDGQVDVAPTSDPVNPAALDTEHARAQAVLNVILGNKETVINATRAMRYMLKDLRLVSNEMVDLTKAAEGVHEELTASMAIPKEGDDLQITDPKEEQGGFGAYEVMQAMQMTLRQLDHLHRTAKQVARHVAGDSGAADVINQAMSKCSAAEGGGGLRRSQTAPNTKAW